MPPLIIQYSPSTFWNSLSLSDSEWESINSAFGRLIVAYYCHQRIIKSELSNVEQSEIIDIQLASSCAEDSQA
ncbi:hypothetical protein TNCV_1049631 [Trichonephila clavipes]|nr:hypothetical protein TNCV_1049631 [Trichonephila clavipes]